VLACLAAMAVALAQDGAPGFEAPAYDELDQVTIFGEQTPPIWKLSKKGNVLWILGTFRPQLRGRQLTSRRVEQLIAGSQQVILPGPAFVASPGVSVMTHAVKSDRNPGGATLQSLLSPEDYASWVALRQKYSGGAVQSMPKFAWGANNVKWVVLTEPWRGGDGIDGMRPTFAWEALRRASMDRYGLASYDLESAVGEIAKKHGVPVKRVQQGREVILVWSMDPAVESIDTRKVDPLEVIAGIDYGDIGCLRSNLAMLEPVMEMRRVQASAWARGDLDAMTKADSGLRLRDCVTELVAAVSGGRLPGSVDAKKAQDRYHRANRDSSMEVQNHWMSAVQDAVKKNKVTFSILPIDRLLAGDGYLAALRKKGFVLEDQQQD
jgi:hypothetical protein